MMKLSWKQLCLKMMSDVIYFEETPSDEKANTINELNMDVIKEDVHKLIKSPSESLSNQYN